MKSYFFISSAIRMPTTPLAPLMRLALLVLGALLAFTIQAHDL